MKINKILEAVELHFRSQKSTNEANLDIFLNNAIGVAEHPNVVEETIQMIKNIAEAEEAIQIVQKLKKERH